MSVQGRPGGRTEKERQVDIVDGGRVAGDSSIKGGELVGRRQVRRDSRRWLHCQGH